MMGLVQESCAMFAELLAGKEPAPGGGGASAMTGALGAALGGMVAALTIGKKKYARVEEELKRLQEEAGELRQELLALVERDAEVFLPLAAAYSMPRETEDQRRERDRVMEDALRTACSVPLEIMRKACRAIELQQEFAEKGSLLAISDAGVGAVLCKAALEGAALNVFVNTGLMKDRGWAEAADREVEAMLEHGVRLADRIRDAVARRIR